MVSNIIHSLTCRASNKSAYLPKPTASRMVDTVMLSSRCGFRPSLADAFSADELSEAFAADVLSDALKTIADTFSESADAFSTDDDDELLLCDLFFDGRGVDAVGDGGCGRWGSASRMCSVYRLWPSGLLMSSRNSVLLWEGNIYAQCADITSAPAISWAIEPTVCAVVAPPPAAASDSGPPSACG